MFNNTQPIRPKFSLPVKIYSMVYLEKHKEYNELQWGGGSWRDDSVAKRTCSSCRGNII